MSPTAIALRPSLPVPNGPARDVICQVCDQPGADTTVEARGNDVEVRCSCGALLLAVRIGTRRRGFRR